MGRTRFGESSNGNCKKMMLLMTILLLILLIYLGCSGTSNFTGMDYDYSTNACQISDLGRSLDTLYNMYSLKGGRVNSVVAQYDGTNTIVSDGYSDRTGNPFLRCDKTKKPLAGCDNYILQVPSVKNDPNATSIYHMQPDSRNQTCVKGTYITDVAN